MTRFVTGSDGHKVSFITHGVNQIVNVAIAADESVLPFRPSTQLVRIVATEGCHYRFGVAPTALVTDPILPADTIEYVGVVPGDLISIIQLAGGAGAGILSITEAS